MDSIDVELEERSYPIHFGRGALDVFLGRLPVHKALGAGEKMALLVDENVERLYGESIRRTFPKIPQWVVPSGEKSKSLGEMERALEFLSRQNLDRDSVLLSIGGGVTGDLAGFTAAVYLRGIRYYQVPTTLLAMVDSAVGGKTGVNLSTGKNLVGAFLQPQGVGVWLPFLESLPAREFSAGMAEVIKYAILGDEDLFHLLEKSGGIEVDAPMLETIVARCCAIKAEVVAADENEKAKEGGRALLNLGHTFGHAIEAVSSYGTYLHGEAVAIGMMMAARFSEESGFLDTSEVVRIRDLLVHNHLPIVLSEPLPVDELLAAMSRDKKTRTGRIRLVLPKEIGSSDVVEASGDYLLRQLWEEFLPG